MQVPECRAIAWTTIVNAAAARDDEGNGDDVSKSFAATSSSQTASINTSVF